MKKSGIDMCNGPLLPKLVLFALPLIATGLLQVFYNAADIIVVGKFAGDNALAAVTSTSSLISLMVNLFLGLSTGVSAVVALHLGARHTKKVHQSVHTSIVMGAIGGIFLMFVGLFLAEPLLRLMGVPDDTGASVLKQAALYVRIYFLGMPFFLTYNFGAAVLRANGDTRRPLVFLAISGLVNVALNLVLVIVFHMGVAGVAIATTTSQVLSAVLLIRCLIKEKSLIRLIPSHLRLDFKMAGEILRLGLPSGIQSSLFAISNVLIQSTVNSFGSYAMAGGGAAGNIESFAYTAMNAFYHASLNFTAQNFGAKKFDRMVRSCRYSLLLVAILGMVIGGGIVLFSEPLLRIYTNSPEAIRYGTMRVMATGIPYFFCGLMEVMTGHIRGMGYSIMPMLVSLIGACGLRVVWIFTVFEAFPTFTVLFLSYPVTWCVTFLTHVICAKIVRKKTMMKLNTSE